MIRAALGLLLALALSACADPAACTEACDRPFAIAEREGEAMAAVWSKMPEPLASESAAAVAAWRASLADARAAYVSSCVPGCEKSRPEVVRCRRMAGNLGEWKRCEGQ